MTAEKKIGIRFLKSTGKLHLDDQRARDEFDGFGLDRLSGTSFFAPYPEIRSLRLSSLRAALIAANKAEATGGGFCNHIYLPKVASLIVSMTEYFDGKHSPVHHHWFDLDNQERLLLCLQIDFNREEWDSSLIEQTISPMLETVGGNYVDADQFGDGPFVGNSWLWNLRFQPPARSTVSSALKLAATIEKLLKVVDEGKPDSSTTWNLICAGHAQVLYGQPESEWLEVKVHDWDLSTEGGKIELSQDIARFANGDNEGILIVGLGTKYIDGVEWVIRGPIQQFTQRDATRHHKVLDQRIYPPIDGLRVNAVDSGNGGTLLAFKIPKQAAELKPFLVHGVIVESKTEGAFFSVVRRRGEHSIPVTAQALHAQIAAGRAFLRLGTGSAEEKAPSTAEDTS
ncbi:AlbA family DNA-binding domain-containing protein [Amycolatopsis sp. NBC_01480]|uniref:AlbA family DNA-binding domain-containing protein n=1 Tax=Amycolatopsis sp. NBC_01480 TaxID=2903562 RepID=UPI002E2A1DA9|nr:hypothetical protein [Amycolatopsis sp. NBC_01480]